MDCWKPYSAMNLAHRLHQKQTHGLGPYFLHLAHVVNVLLDFGYGHDHELIAAAWLHDAVEDQDLTREFIVQNYSPRVDELVWAVSGFGSNRAARGADMKAKIKAYPDAGVLKVADRIANVEASIGNPRYRSMYAKEAVGFATHIGCYAPVAMQDRLARAYQLLEVSDPVDPDAEAKRRYIRHTDNAGIHSNRFPAWSELTEQHRQTWRQPEDDR